MRAYKGSGKTTPPILNFSTTYTSAINVTPQHPINSGLMGPTPGLGTLEKRKDLASPSRKSSQDHPTQSPHWLHNIVPSVKTSRLFVGYGTVVPYVIIIENTNKQTKFSFKSRLIRK
jgi:hypothetical protein